LSRRAAPGNSRYNLIYADEIDLFGVSLGKNIAGVSVGAELSYRHKHAAEQSGTWRCAWTPRPR
jgi:hypothetical protein